MDMSILHPSTTVRSSPLFHLPSPIHQLRRISTVEPIKALNLKKIRSTRIVAISSGGAQGGMKEQTWTLEGLITESLPNGMFKVKMENGDVVLGHVSGKIRQSRIKILPGDMVRIEVSRYDSTRGRITYRLKAKGRE